MQNNRIRSMFQLKLKNEKQEAHPSAALALSTAVISVISVIEVVTTKYCFLRVGLFSIQRPSTTDTVTEQEWLSN